MSATNLPLRSLAASQDERIRTPYDRAGDSEGKRERNAIAINHLQKVPAEAALSATED